MKPYPFLFIVLFLAGTVNAQLADSSWPTFHGSSLHDGRSKYNTSHVDGTVKWAFEAGGEIESSPVIDKNGIIYFGAHDGYLYAINPDGTLKWAFNAGTPVYDPRWNVTKSIMATPAIAEDGTIYAYSSANYLFAINPDGAMKWKFPVKWGNDFWSSPSIGKDGTIYIGSARAENDPNYRGGLFAINPDGTEKWFFEDSSGITSTAAIGRDGTIYTGGNDPRPDGKEGNIGTLLAISQNGKLIWKFKIENWMESSASIGDNGTIYTGTGREARFYAINPDGTVKWQFQANTGTSSIPAIGKDGTVFAGAWDTYMYALDKNGNLKWKFKTPDAFEGIGSSAAIGAEGTIYFGSNAGIFYALYPNGSEKWHYNTSSSIPGSPAIGPDGTVYIGAWNKKLYAFGGPKEGSGYCERIELIHKIRLAEPIACPFTNKCIRWNYDGTNCYEYGDCKSSDGFYCNLIVKNTDSKGGDVSFKAGDEEYKRYIEKGTGHSFSWHSKNCDYSDFKILAPCGKSGSESLPMEKTLPAKREITQTEEDKILPVAENISNINDTVEEKVTLEPKDKSVTYILMGLVLVIAIGIIILVKRRISRG
jgi:outer membrane protein assembly factor BamB